MMSDELERKNGAVEKFIVHYKLSFKHLCLAAVICPLMALVVCFITAYIFQANDIHETHCRVTGRPTLFNTLFNLFLVLGVQYNPLNKCHYWHQSSTVPVAN